MEYVKIVLLALMVTACSSQPTGNIVDPCEAIWLDDQRIVEGYISNEPLNPPVAYETQEELQAAWEARGNTGQVYAFYSREERRIHFAWSTSSYELACVLGHEYTHHLKIVRH